MLSTGTFPDILKFSEIKPIYKKRWQNTNYQLQANFITFCPFKNFEKIVHERPYHHLTSNNILVKEQFGFRCNSSTEIIHYLIIYYHPSLTE